MKHLNLDLLKFLLYSFSFWWGNFFWEKDLFPLFILVIWANFSSLEEAHLIWIHPPSCRQSCHSLSKYGCTYQPFTVVKNVFHEYGRPSKTFWMRSSSSKITPMLMIWSHTWDIFINKEATISSFSIFRLKILFFKALF